MVLQIVEEQSQKNCWLSFQTMCAKVLPISGDVSDFADAKRMVDQVIAGRLSFCRCLGQ